MPTRRNPDAMRRKMKELSLLKMREQQKTLVDKIRAARAELKAMRKRR